MQAQTHWYHRVHDAGIDSLKHLATGFKEAWFAARGLPSYPDRIAENIPHLVWVTDNSGAVEYCNNKWTEYTGLGNHHAIGHQWIEVVHPDQQDAVMAAWMHACTTGEPYKIELQMREHSGEYRWFLARAVPVRDGRGMIQKWIGTCSDIHDVKKATEERERLVFDLQRAVRVRDEFLSVASHELRTPLTTLMLHIGGLCTAATEPKMQERCRAVKLQVERLEALVEKLLDVSCIQATGHLKLDLESVDLGVLVTRVVNELTRQRPNGSTISVQTEDNVTGQWDRVRLVQVATNLLTNAQKYGLNQPIEVAVRSIDSKAILTVHDHGTGIDPANQGRIFDRFERAVSDRNFSGLGLGLWITREIVRALHGTIDVDSALGKGSTFTVSLPLQESHVQEVVTAHC